jgi:hypothetical protein
MGGNPRQYSLKELNRTLRLLRQWAPQSSETIERILPCILFHILIRDCHGFD